MAHKTAKASTAVNLGADKDVQKQENGGDYLGTPPSQLANAVLYLMGVEDIILFLSAVSNASGGPNVEDATEAMAQLILNSLEETGLMLVRKEY